MSASKSLFNARASIAGTRVLRSSGNHWVLKISSRSMRAFCALALALAFNVLAPATARADIGVTATSDQTVYFRGHTTNTFVFNLALFSTVFETADNIHFRFPDNVTISAARYVAGNNTCPDAFLLVLGMGTNEAGWFNPGHPSSCGYFFVSPTGEPQTFEIDAEIPADYVGDLPVLISVDGDQCCDPPPHEATATLTFSAETLTPLAEIGPNNLAVSLDADLQRIETVRIAIDNPESMDFTVTTAATEADCANPSAISWLSVTPDHGSVSGGTPATVAARIDSTGLAGGSYSALICVATTDLVATSLAIPVTLEVTPGACIAADRLFADGFDPPPAAVFAEPSPDACNGSLRTFANREAFLSEVAAGYSEERYTGLRSGPLFGPIVFGNDTFSYSVFTQDDPLNASLRLFAGSGVLSTASSADQLTVTFTGAPVTAIGGDFFGRLFFVNYDVTVPLTTIVLTLDDGRSETFKADLGASFRGFISTKPIRSLSVASPDTDPDGDIPWGVMDNFVVGRAR